MTACDVKHFRGSVAVSLERACGREKRVRVLVGGEVAEGSAKFVPKTPGRHIVSEMDGIALLNPATYKPEHPVKFIILNDAVLVARPRQRRAGDRAKLVAERCWPLNELQVLDTRDNSSSLISSLTICALLNLLIRFD